MAREPAGNDHGSWGGRRHTGAHGPADGAEIQAFGGLWGTEAAQLGGCPGAEAAPITWGLTPMGKAPDAAAIGWTQAFAHLHAECVCALSGLVA
jgi:hypothetical protein